MEENKENAEREALRSPEEEEQIRIAKEALARMSGSPVSQNSVENAVQRNIESRSKDTTNSGPVNTPESVTTVSGLKDDSVKKAIQKTEESIQLAREQANAITPLDERKQRLEMLQQLYFSFDRPVPWKRYEIYPVKVIDYYKFYGAINCLTIDKNSDPTGIKKTHLGYAISKMLSEEEGPYFIQQFINIMEMSLHIQNGLFCSDRECALNLKECDMQDEFDIVDLDGFFARTISYDRIKKKISQFKSQEEAFEFINNSRSCPCCGKPMRDIYNLKQEEDKNYLYIFDDQISKEDYELLRDIIRFMNMLDYNDDYINPELKEELELKAKLQNPNNVPPTLEKQMACVVAGTGYKYDDIYNMTIRRMTYTLREVDALLHYQIMKTSSMSGFVKFKSDIEHWVWGGNEKKGAAGEVQRLDNFKQKLSGAG